MRKLALVSVASVALFSAACGGGGSAKTDNASANVNANAKANTGVNKTAAEAAAAKVCDSQAAITFAGTAAANAANSAGKDFKAMSQTLKDDAAAAPSEIKVDFTLLANTYGAYFDVVASHNGNMMAIAQDPDARAKLQALGQSDVKTAAEHITAYFRQHCGVQ